MTTPSSRKRGEQFDKFLKKLIGRKFTKWTVDSLEHGTAKGDHTQRLWYANTTCACGNKGRVSIYNLMRKMSTRCRECGIKKRTGKKRKPRV